MDVPDFLDELEDLLVPSEYTRKLDGMPPGWRLYKKGIYIFAAVPYDRVPDDDYGNGYAKREIRKRLFAMPFFAQRGLFLLYYGPADDWWPYRKRHRVDLTGLRPVITQALHFVDPETGDSYGTETAWGPIKFAFAGSVINKIERLCDDIEEENDERGGR